MKIVPQFKGDPAGIAGVYAELWRAAVIDALGAGLTSFDRNSMTLEIISATPAMVRWLEAGVSGLKKYRELFTWETVEGAQPPGRRAAERSWECPRCKAWYAVRPSECARCVPGW